MVDDQGQRAVGVNEGVDRVGSFECVNGCARVAERWRAAVPSGALGEYRGSHVAGIHIREARGPAPPARRRAEHRHRVDRRRRTGATDDVRWWSPRRRWTACVPKAWPTTDSTQPRCARRHVRHCSLGATTTRSATVRSPSSRTTGTATRARFPEAAPPWPKCSSSTGTRPRRSGSGTTLRLRRRRPPVLSRTGPPVWVSSTSTGSGG